MDNIESLSALPILYTSKGKRAVGRYLTEITPSQFQQYNVGIYPEYSWNFPCIIWYKVKLT